jgi:hypothetical protein
LSEKIATGAYVPVRELAPTVDPGFEAVIERCLRVAPEQRYGTMADLARALAPFASPASQRHVDSAVRWAKGEGTAALAPEPRGATTRRTERTDPTAATVIDPPRRSSRAAWIALGAACAVALAVVGYRTRTPPPPPPAHASAAPAPPELRSELSASVAETAPAPPASEAAPSAAIPARASARPLPPKRKPQGGTGGVDLGRW